MLRTSSEILQPIREKVEAGERLTAEDGLVLESPEAPLPEVGELANLVRERKNGDAGYYNINTHLNPTNVCVYRCSFCAFRVRPASGPEGLLDAGRADPRPRARGGRRTAAPRCTSSAACTTRRSTIGTDGSSRCCTRTYPELHLKAWTPVEIDWFARLTKKPIRWVLEDMKEAGLGSLPGGGAEIFHPRSATRSASTRPTAAAGSRSHREAHALGLRSNCTMLYGHIEEPYHRIDHLMRLRKLQDETNGFQTFIPLSYHPENTKLGIEKKIKKPSGLMDLRQMAIARLMLDNIDHMKAYWIMLGVGTAQIALSYGADDIDGTVRHELIYHDAGATTPEVMSVEDIERLIREAGREPIERDTLYRRVERDAESWRLGEKITAAV